jgi:hypothetical protein
MQLIRYHGWPIALAGADEVHFHPALLELAELDEGHALVRFACALALHAFEVATGLEQGPFDQRRAERFARTLLMPHAQFAAVADEGDAALAAWFGVPVEQVPLRRAELGLGAPRGAAVRLGQKVPRARVRARVRQANPTEGQRGVSMTDEITLLVADRGDELRLELVGQLLADGYQARPARTMDETRCHAGHAPELLLLGDSTTRRRRFGCCASFAPATRWPRWSTRPCR